MCHDESNFDIPTFSRLAFLTTNMYTTISSLPTPSKHLPAVFV